MDFSGNGRNLLGLERFSRIGSNGFQWFQMSGFYFVFLRNWTAGFRRIGTFGFSVNLFSDAAFIFSNHHCFKCNLPLYLFFNSMIFRSIDENLETMG